MIKLVSDTIDKEDINYLVEWLTQDEIPKLTKGDLTVELEKKWAKKIGTKYSVFVNSGSSAILLSLAAILQLNILRNKKIIVPGLSWATDVSSPILLGMTPIMCDCNFEDLSCDLNHLEQLFIEHNPGSMILVSPLGLVPDMKRIVNLCEKYKVILFEDVCESMGSKYQDRYLGTFGFASFFSMYFGHHLSTIEGGFINTNDYEFYKILLMMRSHGWDRDLPETEKMVLRKKYDVDDFDALYNFYVPGFNLRSTDLQAFIGLRSIEKLDLYSKIRENNFKIYIESIEVNELSLKVSDSDFVSNFAMPVLSKNKKKIIRDLIAQNIEVRPLIAGDMSKKPMWVEKFGEVLLPNCSLINEYGFYLPNHQNLNGDEISKICNILNKYKNYE